MSYPKKIFFKSLWLQESIKDNFYFYMDFLTYK